MDATEPLRAAAPSLGWVDVARLHLTLKFLGRSEPDVVPRLRSTVDRVARSHRPFALHIRGVGAFPNFRRARVVWMGIEYDPKLELLHHDIELASATHGYEVEGRPFRPHITLARVRERTEPAELRALSRASRDVEFEADSDVRSVDLMLSTPAAGGSRYECLHAAGFGGGR